MVSGISWPYSFIATRSAAVSNTENSMISIGLEKKGTDIARYAS
jgi:hypothetical protein